MESSLYLQAYIQLYKISVLQIWVIGLILLHGRPTVCVSPYLMLSNSNHFFTDRSENFTIPHSTIHIINNTYSCNKSKFCQIFSSLEPPNLHYGYLHLYLQRMSCDLPAFYSYRKDRQASSSKTCIMTHQNHKYLCPGARLWL